MAEDALTRRIQDLEAELHALRLEEAQRRRAPELPRRAQTGLPLELEEYVRGLRCPGCSTRRARRLKRSLALPEPLFYCLSFRAGRSATAGR
jgi:hypothetical protein